jgi:hypothetical protein
MAGVLERIRRSQKQLVKPCSPLAASSSKVLELQTAKEILVETFGISIDEVEEMLKNRFEADSCEPSKEEGLWPREFWIDS